MHVFKHVQAFVIYQIVPIIVIQINIIQKMYFNFKILNDHDYLRNNLW